MRIVDSHCHLEDIRRARWAGEMGVCTILNAGKDVDEMDAQLEMCEELELLWQSGGEINEVPFMWTSAGVHPENALAKLEKVDEQMLLEAAQNKYVTAIGECGLDYHYGADFKEAQKEMFSRHIEAAGKSGLPLMIHMREAEADMVEMLRTGKNKYPALQGVIHCFCSHMAFADEMLEIGFYLSASGIITFKNGADVAEVFRRAPKDKILVETDSPYLAPVPYRGRENQPAYIIKTVEKLAQIRGIDAEKCARLTLENFYKLYRKASKGQGREFE